MDFDFDKFDDNKKVDDLEPPVDYRKDEKEKEPSEEEKKDDKKKKRKKSTKSSARYDCGYVHKQRKANYRQVANRG